MEAPLNKKAQDRVDRFEPVWKQVTLFMLKLAGVTVKPENVTVNFDKPETVQPRTTAETRQMNVNAGMSLTTVWREEGKTDEWIQQALKDMEADKKRNEANMAQVMLEAERRFSAPVEGRTLNVENQTSNLEGQRSNE